MLSTLTQLAINIRLRRIALGLTQEQLARKLGKKSRSVVCSWESGNTAPPADLLPAVAVALETTVGFLFGEDSTGSEDAAEAA